MPQSRTLDRVSGPVDASRAVERLLAAAGSGELDDVCVDHGVRLLGLFGSAVSPGSQNPDDVDVAVSFAGPPDELGLLDELTRITQFDRIDLAVIDGANPVLRAEALVGLPLFEREHGAYANTQMAALAERRDTEWLRKLDLRALSK